MKRSNYIQAAMFLLNILLIILSVIMAYILYTFAERTIKADYTTTTVRGIQITLPPQKWDFKTRNYLMITGTNPNAYLRSVEGEFETHNSPLGLFVYVHLYDLAFFAALFVIAFLLRKFFKSISAGNPFNSQNIKILKTASQIIMIGIFSDIVCKEILWFLLKDINFADGTRVAMNRNYNYFFILIVGYLILAIVKIIEDGIKIKEENDLTV